jgi:16S rRNA (guanine966-N2)-methyltransferase
MRIIGGTFRGLALASVGKGDRGAHLRPTTDRVRESLFNVLLGGKYDDPISDMMVLDLFAGTGALGLEALSRGASGVTFVDDGRKAQSLISENIQKCRAENCQIIKRDATRLPAYDGTRHGLVFVDPPYSKGLGQKAVINAMAQNWIAPEALIVFEDSTTCGPMAGCDLLDTRRYGATHISFLRVH